MVILTRMKNKQIQYMIAFLKVRQKKKHIRSCVQIYMQETDGGGRIKNGKWKCWTVLSLQYIISIYAGTSLELGHLP